MAIFRLENNQLYWQRGEEKLLIQPWGNNGLRVRVTRAAQLELSENWALLPAGEHTAQMAMVKTAPQNHKQMAAAGGPGEDAVTVQRDGQPPAAVPARQLPPAPTRHVRYWVEMMTRDLPNDIVGVDDLSNSGVSIDNAAEYVDILDAIYRSAREGCTVAL